MSRDENDTTRQEGAGAGKTETPDGGLPPRLEPVRLPRPARAASGRAFRCEEPQGGSSGDMGDRRHDAAAREREGVVAHGRDQRPERAGEPDSRRPDSGTRPGSGVSGNGSASSRRGGGENSREGRRPSIYLMAGSFQRGDDRRGEERRVRGQEPPKAGIGREDRPARFARPAPDARQGRERRITEDERQREQAGHAGRQGGARGGRPEIRVKPFNPARHGRDLRTGRADLGEHPGRPHLPAADQRGRQERVDFNRHPARGQDGKNRGNARSGGVAAARDGRPEMCRLTQAEGRQVMESRGKRLRDDLFDVLILGAGASGLACAARCRELGLSVCVVDRAREPGRKLAMAGGGRANFTNRNLSADNYLCSRPGFVAPALRQFGWRDALALVEGLDLPWEERAGGRFFLTAPAGDFVSSLLTVCRTGDFSLCMSENFRAEDVRLNGAEGVSLLTREGTRRRARRLVVALGSPALPASGSSGFGYALAQSLGHRLVPPQAALTPMLLAGDSPLLGLQGVSARVVVTTCGRSFEGDMLFTHDGVSGPAILKASLFWQSGAPVTINFLPDADAGDLLSDEGAGRGTPRSLLSRHMPQALVDSIVPEEVRGRRAAEIPKSRREEIARSVSAFTFTPLCLAGLRRAEVCRGGVDTEEIAPLSFASRLHPEVSFIGEVLDVTGLLGGYNLHWAFASGCLAAEAIRGELG